MTVSSAIGHALHVSTDAAAVMYGFLFVMAVPDLNIALSNRHHWRHASSVTMTNEKTPASPSKFTCGVQSQIDRSQAGDDERYGEAGEIFGFPR